MSVEELRKKRALLKANTNITFENMQVIADESNRVAEVAHNSRKILENLDAEFERQTGLNRDAGTLHLSPSEDKGTGVIMGTCFAFPLI